MLWLVILHLSFLGGLGKGTCTEPLYAVILSCYTLQYVERYISLCRWVGFVSGTAQFQEFAKVQRNFEIGFPFRNWFAISQFLICAVQFRNCRNLQIARNIYSLTIFPYFTFTIEEDSQIKTVWKRLFLYYGKEVSQFFLLIIDVAINLFHLKNNLITYTLYVNVTGGHTATIGPLKSQ